MNMPDPPRKPAVTIEEKIAEEHRLTREAADGVIEACKDHERASGDTSKIRLPAAARRPKEGPKK